MIDTIIRNDYCHTTSFLAILKNFCLGVSPNIVGAHEKVHTVSEHLLVGLINVWRLSLDLQKLYDMVTLHIDARKHCVEKLREIFCIAFFI